jgi:hypothetical protein
MYAKVVGDKANNLLAKCNTERPYRLKIVSSMKIFTGLVLVSLLLGGCTSRINHFKNFSDAGVIYADTMNKLLGEAGGVSIDGDSAVLLETRSGLSTGFDGERDKTFDQHNKLLQKRLNILGDIRDHTLLLKSYFEALAALAGSDVGTGISTATQGIVSQLDQLNPKITNAKLGAAPIGALIGPVTELLVASFQQAVLDEELKANSNTIERELALHVAAIKSVAAIWKTDHQVILSGQDIENRNLFLQNKALPGNWAKTRKAILVSGNSLELVDSATMAAENLKITFENLVENKVSAEDIPLIFNDLNKVMDLIELVKKGPSA